MQPKLLRNPKTDMTAHGHEQSACRVSDIPIHAQPDVHSGAKSNVGCGSKLEHVTAAAILCYSRDAVIL
jgi:hypothetical protein